MAKEAIPEGMDIAQFFSLLSPQQQRQFYQGPAMTPPDGVVPNFDNPPNKDTMGYGVIIASAVLSTLAVAARLYSRLFVGKMASLRLEDYLVIVAWIIFGVFLVYVYKMVIFPGAYVHQWNVRYIDLVQFLYHLSTSMVAGGTAIGLTKAAILLDWLHIFVPHRTRNAMAWTIYFLIAINSLYYLAGTIAEIFGCTPRKKIWDKTTPGTCTNTKAGFLIAASFNVVCDSVILALPQKIIWGLNLTPAKKIGISSLFAIGIFACVCAVTRLVYSVELVYTEDVTYAVSPVGLWSIGEITSSFLLVGVPSVPRILRETPLVKAVLTSIRSLVRGSKKGTQNNSRKGLPSWYKRKPTARRRWEDTCSEVDVCTLIEIRNENQTNIDLEVGPKPTIPHQVITRETVVEVHMSPKQ